MHNIWIVLEGPDGCGKSTQAKKLGAALLDDCSFVSRYIEPTTEGHGATIREHSANLSARDLMYLFTLDRLNQFSTKILPFISVQNELIRRVAIQDRSWISTAVYQAHELGIREEFITTMHHLMPTPDAYIYLRPSAEEAERRKEARGGKDHFDRIPTKELIRAYDTVFAHSMFNKHRIIVGADLPEDELCDKLTAIIKALY